MTAERRCSDCGTLQAVRLEEDLDGRKAHRIAMHKLKTGRFCRGSNAVVVPALDVNGQADPEERAQ